MAIDQLTCFQATMAHKKHEAFLFYADYTQDLRKRMLERYAVADTRALHMRQGMYTPEGLALRQPEGFTAPDFSTYHAGTAKPPRAFINEIGVLEIPGSMYHFTQFVSPLHNAERFEEIESFPYPSVKDFSDTHLRAEVEAIHGRGHVASAWIGHMYEDSWQIRGYEPFLMDMISQPEWCEFILDKLMEKNIAVATAMARAGVDVIVTGDDVANQNTLMFSLDQWKHFMKGRWAKVYAAVRAIKPDIQIWYHSDGNIETIIPHLIEIGVTILNPVQPECIDPVMVKRKWGDKLVLDGTIGTQTVMPFGTPADVKKNVRDMAEALGQDGALILSPTHTLEPEVPIENIEAFVDACKEYGILNP
ncbi:MAG: hypothetical protein A2268_03490 [Candidatus Raymondbacteria bacterium RifOxyA12_full_50_37]|uniref:Uroporphyrinogen decarboxylase (URO-D) domain-containing protein n=1 Tax=Candidatus Raymondbacteria bacterium RIFOXYD12_FULL_49_13 TaxID=1817890 RepID=A0A1F7F3V6_UNCRA|nr:MAG: hypothetical protein A2268_03490 [Candidatus Raymondbacteria bacterium RifOxyA12_full_50_37]OGJ86714.1 MAG: hypothetical protein A2350_09145 [Candidatus Raymondbacteria bacterium RifOxyB12_full_50_8]OGJ88386.1 MAG: hypothetical protein A2248_00920 [Candidatus Raymondbacteria bacterium RIFOXYA2_FULL_49_16]OGJ96224.1 MAG: hypothetical protein A2453_08650 [Candidatus Raymondbacteria bacterium RIFOXYC2_FULL_50_21]OGK01217.1 MAG: hypothetical protein A2519_22460 [Candidatus Raymondbacteria b